ncbi:hypothetical protein L484_018116 [Morus notabilis]|uniref:Uncharacterized protein n=1 Tax=Morus notabilis TaxID=981085 RepID=W9R5V2_9ROSA|nr:hypothetical protein L484_018116 [Morus notabilis]
MLGAKVHQEDSDNDFDQDPDQDSDHDSDKDSDQEPDQDSDQELEPEPRNIPFQPIHFICMKVIQRSAMAKNLEIPRDWANFIVMNDEQMGIRVHNAVGAANMVASSGSGDKRLFLLEEGYHFYRRTRGRPSPLPELATTLLEPTTS